MNPFVNGYRKFRSDVYPRQASKYLALAKSQKPSTLFITCSDSRVVPSVFTQTVEGELFQCRVVGNLVPAHGAHAGGVSSAIEYANRVLEVPHIIVCGHSDCGAMRAFQHPEKLESLKHVRSWMEHADSAIALAKDQFGHLHGDQFLAALTKENIVAQLANLKTHPSVASRLRKGTLEVHGWYYDIGEGTVEAYDANGGLFLPLDQPMLKPSAQVA
jgi:carbonic anhydrase